ncbi:uncharacterized protein LAESUDRAFT_187407 [Laetiporus sulphureus 93-53]|uniref:Uncharacterized protein n=1 Tax=Laetiporus sulphureus 93-53 TaxID=1314785 RepID=A0A165E5C6_9APHY|nr:uncharacterized protein LAESUDRAFT_187407 [Laetiporus sulphureus 93-53]KZT06268.1 hypothetical protein LAESUDRAFT_187407 [Laetiporus sulphureus 93-53]
MPRTARAPIEFEPYSWGRGTSDLAFAFKEMYYSPNKLVCRLRHHYHVGRKAECQIYKGQHALITDPQFTLNRCFSQVDASTKKRYHAIGNGREESNVPTSTNRVNTIFVSKSQAILQNSKYPLASKPPTLQRKDIDERSHKIKHKGQRRSTKSPKITEEQSFVLDLVKSGKSVFFTGSAGMSKTYK